jgi:hypothetical protein
LTSDPKGRLRLFENTELRIIFGLKINEENSYVDNFVMRNFIIVLFTYIDEVKEDEKWKDMYLASWR